MANPSLVGNGADGIGSTTGFRALRTELQLAGRTMREGLVMGAFELAAGGSKVKAVWESIKWAALTRAGLAGFALLVSGVGALAFGIRKAVLESGALQAAMNRLQISDTLTRQFTALLGSVSAAKSRVTDLYGFAAHSKFSFEDITQASRVLTVFSNGVLGTSTDLEHFGRIANATNTPLADLATTIGQAHNAITNGFDVTGSIQELQRMGVVTEGTVKHFQNLQMQGASSTAILEAFNAELHQSSERAGEVTKSIADLESQTDKAQEAMMAAFGAPFIARHRREVELTGKVYENFTGFAARLGQMLGALTDPFDRVSVKIKEVGATKGFADLASQVGLVTAAMIPMGAAWQAIKGVGKLMETTAAAHTAGGMPEIRRIVAGNFSPLAKSENWAMKAARLAEAEAPTAAVKGAELVSKAWKGVSVALEYAVAGFMRLLPWISRVTVPLAIFTAVTYVAEKAWEKYTDELAKSKRLLDMSESIKKDTEEMRKQAAAMKTQDDYLQLLTSAQNRYNEALLEEARIRANPNMTDDDRHAAAAKVATAKKDLNELQRQDTSALGMGRDQTALALERLRIEKQISEIIFEAQLARASDGEKAILLAQKRAEYERAAAEYQKSQTAAPEIAVARTLYEGAGKTDEAKAAAAKAEVDRLQKEYDKTRVGVFGIGTEHVAGSRGERLEEEARKALDDAQVALAAIEVNKPSQSEMRSKLIAALKKGGRGDQLEAAAFEEEGMARPDQRRVDALRLEAQKQKLIDNETARTRAAELRAASLTHMREMGQTAIGQAAAREALGITSESYGAADAAARLQMRENRERLAEATKGYRPDEANEEARIAHKQQVEAVELANANIQKGIDERARQLAREKATMDAAMAAREEQTKAVRLASEGHFLEAAVLRRSAQARLDAAADVEREHELRAAGRSPEQIAAIQASERAAREEERKVQTAGALRVQGRELTEAQLAVGMRGFNPGGGATGEAARVQLQSMRDIDTLRAQMEQNIGALGANASDDDLRKAAQNATDLVKANILAGVPQQGAGSLADSLTRVGGGGGFYAGATGDPQLAATKRIADLTQAQNEILNDIKKNVGGAMQP